MAPSSKESRRRGLRELFKPAVILALALILGGLPGYASAGPALQDTLKLVYGQTVDGRIETGQPSVLYEFEAQAADVITITMVVTGGELDPFIVLNTLDRVPLATDDNSGGNLNARLTFVIPQSGRYLIQATHAGGIPPAAGGTFTLNLTAAVEIPSPTPEISTTPSDAPTAQGDGVRLLAVTPGTPIRDTLTRQIAHRYYWFAADQGDQIILNAELMAAFQALYVLYDARFTELGRTQPGSILRLRLPETGIYFLVVALPDRQSAGGAYGFTLDRIPNPATAQNYIDIAYGQTQRGTIDASISAIIYRFQGSAGDAIAITMNRAGGDLNCYLYLLNAAGDLLFEDNDSGGGEDARLVYTLPEDGTYLIVATRLGQTQGTTSGSFVLELQSDSLPPTLNNTPDPTLPVEYASLPQMAYGDTVESELSNARFMDFYVFRGTAGDPVTIEMISPTIDLPNGLDPLLILLDDQRIPLAENDDIVDGVQRDARLEVTLPRTGYYAIVATRFDQETGTTSGPYILRLSGPGGLASESAAAQAEMPPLAQLPFASLAPNSPQQGTFDRTGAWFAFTTPAPLQADLAVSTTPEQEPLVILADAALTEVLSSGTGTLTGVLLPEGGRYGVLIAPRFGPLDDAGARYTLNLSLTPISEAAPESGPQALIFGETVQGAIDDTSPGQTYTFAGLAGQRVRITMEALAGSRLDCYLELRDAADTVIGANDDIQAGVIRDSRLVIDLPADGTYTIIATRYTGPDAEPTNGRYRLTLELLAENAVTGVSSTTIPITYGQTQVDEINDAQYLLFYVFDGTAGDVITIEVSHLTGNLDSVLHLYRSEGSGWVEIANNDDSPTGGTYAPLLSDVVLPQTGKYLIAIHRYGLERESSSGTFALTVTRRE